MMNYKLFTLTTYIVYINDKMPEKTWYDFNITILMTH